MADTAYERYRKDRRNQPKKHNIENYSDFQKALLAAVENQTAPKKPVKWFFGKDDDDVGALTLATALSPTLELSSFFQEFKDKDGKVTKPKYVNLNKWIRAQKGQKEKEYISGLDELAKGVETGKWNLSGAVNQLITIPTDFALGTDFTNALQERMNDGRIKPDEPETWRGELTSLGIQFGIPGGAITKLIGRSNALAPVYKFLKLNKANKVSKIARRAIEGATILGATDFLASSPGRPVLNPWAQPKYTKGKKGRAKAVEEFTNKVKYGFEGALIGGVFPLMGKGMQLGYKYLGPKWAAKKTATIGTKAIDNAVFKPISYVLSREAVKPVVSGTSKAVRGMTNWTLTKAIAPTIASGLSGFRRDPVTGKRVWKIVKQLPPFEKWRLGSVTSKDVTERSIHQLDNFLSWFRSYGKSPVAIEGAGEEAMLYGRSVARKFDKAFAGLEHRAYNLAKGFEGQYNKATTSPVMQKYWLDQVDEFIMNQRPLNKLPKELQDLSQQVKDTIEDVAKQFRRALPKGKDGDEYTQYMHDLLAKKTHSYLLRSFSTFTNPFKAVDPKIRTNAVNWIVENVVKKNKNMKEQAAKLGTSYKVYANDMVDQILATGKNDGKNPLEIMKYISKEILQDKKYKFLKTGEELPKVVRQLLGQERNVKFSTLTTSMDMVNQNMAKIAADRMAAQGLKEGWLFKTAGEARRKLATPKMIGRVPRIGNYLKTNLEGLWTSPEYAEMFMGLGTPFANLIKSGWYRHIIQGKAGVQMGKTLYSPTTQVRNVTSASMFALNAGHIGWRASVTDSMRMVIRDIFKEGKGIDDVAFNEQIAKLVRLGVIDENIVATEMKTVLEELKTGKLNTFDKLFEKLVSSLPTDKVGRVYAGGDNLWKFYGYNFDKSMLLEALHSVDDVADFMKHIGAPFNKTNLVTGAKLNLDDSLDRAAAYLIRNSYPTYSKVPPVIQALRKFPLGNFVSFPAEMIRTSTTNIALGLKMASHANPKIRQMGLRRLMGSFMTLYGLGKGMSEATRMLTGISEYQEDAYKRSFAASWNRNANLMHLKGFDNGESLAINFTYFMPYDVMQRPIEAAIAKAHEQNINPNDVNKFVLDMMFSPDGPIMEILEPFVSEPLGYDRLIDVTVNAGRKPGGGRVYTREELEGDLSAVINKSLAYVLDGIKPGVWITSEKISAGLRKDLTRGGKPVNTFDELLALFSGIRLIRIDTKKDLKYYAADLNTLRRDIDEASDFYSPKHYYSRTPGDMEKAFDRMQERDFRLQKDMYIRIQDMKALNVDERTIKEILKDARVNDKLINNLLDGEFTPTNYSKPRFEQKVKAVEEGLEEFSKEGKFEYEIDEDFVFPEDRLDDIKDEWEGKEFFPNGYTPDKTEYKKDSKGRTIYNANGDPIPVEKEGFIEKGFEKIKKFINPLEDHSSKIQTPPLPNTPMPDTNLLASKPQNNGLTRTERALLSFEDQEIARRT